MNKNIRLVLLVTMLALTFLVAGCDSGPAPGSQTAPEKVAEQPQQPNAPASQEKTMQLVVYQATKDAMYLVAETHKVPASSHPARTAIELLIAGPKTPELVSVMPQGTKIRNLVVKDHIAYVDFDDKLIKKNAGGSASEILLVGAIVNTLTEFPDIHKVQILVDGKKIDTISGHMDTGEPLSRTEKIIKK